MGARANFINKRRSLTDAYLSPQRSLPWLALLSLITFLLLNALVSTRGELVKHDTISQKVAESHSADEASSKLQVELETFRKSAQFRNDIEVKSIEGGLQFQVVNANLFIRGATKLRREPARSLSILANWVRSHADHYMVIVEGHTDHSPIMDPSERTYPSNWELSSARASAVARLFVDTGLPSNQLMVIGYGDSRPLVSERGPAGEINYENQALNRRIVIRMIHEKALASYLTEKP